MSLCTEDAHLPKQTSEAIVGRDRLDRAPEGAAREAQRTAGPARDLTYFALLPYLDHERAAAVAGLS